MIKYTAARHDRTSKIGQNLKRYKDGRSDDPVLKNRFIGQRKGSKTGILSLDIQVRASCAVGTKTQPQLKFFNNRQVVFLMMDASRTHKTIQLLKKVQVSIAIDAYLHSKLRRMIPGMSLRQCTLDKNCMLNVNPKSQAEQKSIINRNGQNLTMLQIL